jgi:transmembrane 9 superfamily protein 3
VNVTSGNPIKLKWDNADLKVAFTYSVSWKETVDTYEDRFSKYLDSEFFEHKVISGYSGARSTVH